MALYKQGSQREEDHKAQGLKSRVSGRSHDGSTRVVNGTGPDCRGAGLRLGPGRNVFYCQNKNKKEWGWTRDHTALVTDRQGYLCDCFLQTYVIARKKGKKKGPTVASWQISRRKRGTLDTGGFVLFGAFASRRYIRRAGGWGLLPLRHFTDSEGTEISAFQPSSFFFLNNT